MNIKSLIVLVTLGLAAKYVYDDSKYTIAEGEQVVLVYRSGAPSKIVRSEPGEYYKLPFVQDKFYYGKQINSLDIDQQILTKDYKVVNFDSTVYWKIADPILFYKSLKSLPRANKFISNQFINVELNMISAYKLNELTAESDLSEYKKVNCGEDIVKIIYEKAVGKIAGVGLELKELKITISYPAVENADGQP